MTTKQVATALGEKPTRLYHHVEILERANQVFAFDFVGVGPDGKTFSGDGKRNEDYFGFGRE